MQKELTIQELENLNFDLYKDKPLDLIPFGKKLVSSHRHEKAIELFEFGLKTIIALNNNNEFHIDCAKFNYHYADALIAKLFESNEILNNGNLPAEENREENADKSKSNAPAKDGEQNNMEIDDEGEEEEASEEDDDDEKIAFQHLAVAEKTLKTFLEKYDNLPKHEVSDIIINYYLDLSEVYFKFGELELVKSDFKLALDFFNQSLKYKVAYDSKYSRAIAEVYFMMASACDADANQALVFYYKTYLILLYHLNKEKGTEITDVNFDSIEISPSSLILDKEILKASVIDSDKVKELKETLNDIVTKIEDVCEEIKITKELVSEKMVMKKEEVGFTSNYDEKKVIDISKSGVIKKKNELKSTENKEESLDKQDK